MNLNRNQERDEAYQNAARVGRNFQNRPAAVAGVAQIHPNLNPNYQNPVDLVRNYNRVRQHQEPEENIYERLDNDDDEEENEGENNVEVGRNNDLVNNPNNQNPTDDHIYERIDDRSSCRNRAYSRFKYQMLNLISGGNFLNEIDSRNFNQYDQPRHVYLDSSRIGNQFCQSRLGRLGRNCFSSENLAYASSRRSAYPLGYHCTCPYCRHIDSRYVCHHCQSLYNKLRYQDPANSARQYMYQLSRNCRCPFCRGDYAKLSATNGSNRSTESSSRCKDHHRNPAVCLCRNKTMPSSSSSMQVGRYVDWINRIGSSVNNPLYATIHIGRIDRSCSGSATNGNSVDGTAASTSSGGSSTEPGTSANIRSIFASTSYNPSTSSASVCQVNRSTERQHTCDDSCIRNQNLARICQFLGRCERAECNHSRLSVHWWFVNRWFNPERNVDNPPVEEEPRERPESDSDDS